MAHTLFEQPRMHIYVAIRPALALTYNHDIDDLDLINISRSGLAGHSPRARSLSMSQLIKSADHEAKHRIYPFSAGLRLRNCMRAFCSFMPTHTIEPLRSVARIADLTVSP